MDPILAHLAFLSVGNCSRGPPYAVAEENEFARLQLAFHNATGASSSLLRLLKLSPLLVRSEDLERLVNLQDLELAQRREAAELRSHQAATELLSLLDQEQAQRTKTMERKRRQQKATSKAHSGPRDGDDIVEDEEASIPPAASAASVKSSSQPSCVSESLEDLIAPPTVPLDEATYDSSEWHAPRARARSRGGRGVSPGFQLPGGKSSSNAAVDAAAPAASSLVAEAADLPVVGEPRPASSEGSGRSTGQHSEREPVLSEPALNSMPAAAGSQTVELSTASAAEDVPVAPDPDLTTAAPTPLAIPAPASPAAPSFDGVPSKGQVGELQREVAALQAALEAKDAAHSRELAAAQERESTRLQALQLRLYIASSRIAALEDALAKHIAAVGPLAAGSAEMAVPVPIVNAGAAIGAVVEGNIPSLPSIMDEDEGGATLAAQQLERRMQRASAKEGAAEAEQ